MSGLLYGMLLFSLSADADKPLTDVSLWKEIIFSTVVFYNEVMLICDFDFDLSIFI